MYATSSVCCTEPPPRCPDACSPILESPSACRPAVPVALRSSADSGHRSFDAGVTCQRDGTAAKRKGPPLWAHQPVRDDVARELVAMSRSRLSCSAPSSFSGRDIGQCSTVKRSEIATGSSQYGHRAPGDTSAPSVAVLAALLAQVARFTGREVGRRRSASRLFSGALLPNLAVVGDVSGSACVGGVVTAQSCCRALARVVTTTSAPRPLVDAGLSVVGWWWPSHRWQPRRLRHRAGALLHVSA